MKTRSDNKIELINDLHSQRLRDHFGEINLQIVRQNEFIRVSYLKDKNNILRTFAVVVFSNKQYSKELTNIDAQVRKGGLLGESIRDHGLDVIKKIQGQFKVKGLHENFSFGQFSEVFVRKGDGNDEFYAEVCEIYTPEFSSEYKMVFNYKYKTGLISRIENIFKSAGYENVTINLIQ